MIKVPPSSICPASPATVTLILRIVLKRNVKLYVKRLMISQRLGSFSKLIHRCTRTMRPKKNAQRETIAANLAHRIVHFGRVKSDDQDVCEPALWTDQRSSMAIRISYRKPAACHLGDSNCQWCMVSN